ncbi:YifB family Mg chelatase-like AAA ATPase [Gallicola sp. Sow4_E12]|uniref:YifB family Mg chelatase-like AAA ATPase n=1 Tax=Gallicola sp. Sow4_E12 TaxID=3438785 RepID=UPI003F900229
MYSKINTCVLQGLTGYKIEVEADISKGLRSFNMVGLPDTSIKESKERVRAAIANIGHSFPRGRLTINLAPANLKKEGSQMDLTIAVSILTAMGEIIEPPSEEVAFLGELSLDGRILPVEGALPMIISLQSLGLKKCIIPLENKEESSMVKGIELICVEDLKEVVEYLNGERKIEPFVSDGLFEFENREVFDIDFSDIKGQLMLKRAMEIAAAGEHNLLMIGPPGSGKTMAAMRLPSILPKMTFEEAIECTKIYSVSGELGKRKMIIHRPFRDPHHTSSSVSIIGGGRIPKPGEISLAHNGALFLDELPEFSKSTIEVLRQPLEEKNITIARAQASLTYPANFLFIAGMNPCPCGYNGDPNHECNCSAGQIQKYLNKVSRPILDRIDIHVEVQPVKFSELTDKGKEESSDAIRERVQKARDIQKKRFEKENISTNGLMSSRQIRKYVVLSEELEKVIQTAFQKYKFSARSFNKILKLTRTIADLEGSEEIKSAHLMEAIRYRTIDQKYWG